MDPWFGCEEAGWTSSALELHKMCVSPVGNKSLADPLESSKTLEVEMEYVLDCCRLRPSARQLSAQPCKMKSFSDEEMDDVWYC